MLKVYKGEASRSYENVFFRIFAKTLTLQFEKSGLDGVLLGMPKCLIRDTLQIDALLITKKSIILIDFKEYTGGVILPNDDTFWTRRWENNNENSETVFIKGGSSVNPFVQLSRQRKKLIEIFDKTLDRHIRFSKDMVATMVCFCNPVNIIGSIPGKYKLSFFIADAETFASRLIDIIDVGGCETNLLDDKFINYLNHKIFETPEYDLTGVTGVDPESPPEQLLLLDAETTALSTDIEEKISGFLNSDSRVMIITGTVGSDKESLLSNVRDSAHDAGFLEAKVLVISKRIRNNLLRNQEDVESLYSTIYDVSAQSTNYDLQDKKLVPLRTIESIFDDETLHSYPKQTLFIVEESHMIADSFRDDPLIRFGSGKLLSDVISYLQLRDKECPNKIIFIGDKYLRPIGSWEESSLNPDYFTDVIGDVTLIELPDISNPTPIQAACLQIADSVREEDYSDLYLTDSDSLSFVKQNQEHEVLRRLVSSQSSSKILVYSNVEARDLNLYIKRKFINNGTTLAKGDLIIFHNQIETYTSTEPIDEDSLCCESQPSGLSYSKRIENGSFGKIIHIRGEERIQSYGDFKDEYGNKIKLSFVSARIMIEDGVIFDTYILEDYLYSDTSKLGQFHEQEYQIFLKRIRTDFEKLHPFQAGNKYFDEMIQNGDYELNQEGKYRRKDNKTKLTTYEIDYRNDISEQLRTDSGNMYYKVNNAARLKFGWCLTVNKAMSYEWSDVVLFSYTGDRGRTNPDYYKWLYTGISRGTTHVSLARWRPITIFEKTEFGISSNTPKTDESFITFDVDYTEIPMQLYEHLLGVLENTNIRIQDKISNNYQEQIKFEDDCSEATLIFYYNKKGVVKQPSLKSGGKDLFARLQKIFSTNSFDKLKQIQSPLSKCYTDFQRIIPGSIIKIVKSEEYQDVIEVAFDEEKTSIQIWHDKKTMISKFNYIGGSKLCFDKIVDRIKEYFGINR